jgi:thermitase
MRRGLRGLGVAGLALGLGLTAVPAFADEAPAGDAVSLVVGLRSGTDTDAPVDRLTDRTDVDVMDSAPIAADSAVTVEVPAGDVAETAAALRSDPDVRYVEVDQVATTSVVPNDPSYSSQWGLPRAKVTQAWSATTGSTGITIAVVDTGVKSVSELSGRLLTGYDFVNGDTNATDDEGHGTMTATVLAGRGNNSIGIAGICWSCRVLPVKVLGADGSGLYSDIAQGIRYAADQGAEVINMSLGGSADSQVLRDAVTYAVGKGSLVIAAAGNDGSSAKHYPAAIPEVLAVGASTAGDARYPWSNWGSTWVDIAAPGCNLAQDTAGQVAQFCGTSSATPFVAGVAGLLASVTPTPTAAQIRTALTSSADSLSGNWIASTSGRVNAAAALDALPFWVKGVTSGAALNPLSATLRPHVAADSGITEVSAKLDGVTLATATSAPWTLVLDTSGVSGAATLTLTALAGATTRATLTLPVIVDRDLPETSFRFPAASALVRGTVTVGANAWDKVGVAKVQLLVGSTIVAVDSAAPFALQWPSGVRNGATVLTLRTYDKAGNLSVSSRTVVADNWGPSAVITSSPAGGTRRIRGTVKVGAKAADRNGIRFLDLVVNGKVVSRSTSGAHTFPVDTARYGSSLKVQVRAFDRAGNVRYSPTRTWYR